MKSNNVLDLSSKFSNNKYCYDDTLDKVRSKKSIYLNTGRPLFDMGMINPDLEPPRLLLDKLQEAIALQGIHRYSVAKGIKRLREGFSNYYEHEFDVILSSDKNICATLGAKDALHILLETSCKRGELILLPSPVYPAYRSSAELLGLKISEYKVDVNAEVTLKNICSKLASEKISLLLLNFPNNPTGIYYDKTFYLELQKYISFEGLKDLHICNDFTYADLYYEEKPISLLSVFDCNQDNVSEIYTMSKSYSIPGWRIGGILGNEKIISKIAEYKAKVDFGIFMPLQIAAASILLSKDNVYLEKSRNIYLERLKYLAKVMKKHSWEVQVPKSGMCLWAKIPNRAGSQVDDFYVFDYLLNEFGIAVLPGTAFGEDYSRFIRLALVLPEEKLYSLDSQFDLAI